MRCFDGHCDTLARCMATGEGLRQNMAGQPFINWYLGFFA